MAARISPKRRRGGGATGEVVSSSVALQTQLASTRMKREAFKRLGDPRLGGRRAMHYLGRNDLLISASTCLILREWASYYNQTYAFSPEGATMPRRTDGTVDSHAVAGRIVARFPILRTVRLNISGEAGGSLVDDTMVRTLASGCAALRDLDVAWCTELTDASVIALANGCRALRRVNLRKCVKITDTSIVRLVAQCSALTDIDLRGCEKITVATLAAIATNCADLRHLCIGYRPRTRDRVQCDSVSDDSVSALFAQCPKLTSIAFTGCVSLTSVLIPNSVTIFGDNAFKWCSSLTAITIPDSVASIGKHAFAGCSSLTAITIPDLVTSIGDRAFFGCSSLTAITIPDSVTSIGNGAFYGCSSLVDPPQLRNS